MDSAFAGRRKQVESALLDYQRTPGKYPLLLRRPEILFSSIREVLQLASGRLPDGAAMPGLAVQRAAGFFVRTAMLYPAADHYALLGLDRTADAAAIKERYRQMMRLMHPDFAGNAATDGNWPADAASRINQAYEVLASSVQRRGYDEKLTPSAAPAPSRGLRKHSVAQVQAAAGAPAPDPRRLLKRMAGAFGILGAIALAASLLAAGPDRESLVQRVTSRPPPAQSTVVQAEVNPAPVKVQHEQSASTAAAQLQRGAPPAADHALALPAASPKLEPALPATPVHARMIAVSVEAPAAATLAAPAIAPLPASLPTPLAAPLPAPLAAPLTAELPASAAPAVQAPPVLPLVARGRPQPAPKPVLVPAVTMAEAHPLMAALLQQMESGSGERLLSGLDRSARTAPAAQALMRQYDRLVEGSRSVKVSNLLLKGAAREDRLLVKGQVLLEIGGETATRASELMLEAEFAKRDGVVLMTRLAPVQPTGAAAK